MKKILNSPTVYHAFQRAGGFFSARTKAIHQYLDLQKEQRIVDIGCGPGHIVAELPEGVVYYGFDVDEGYIRFANEHFGTLGRFYCRLFDEAAAADFGPADVVMMNGVLHHLDDATLSATIETVSKALRPEGIFFALDGVYAPDQSAVAKWLLNNDRGKFVRTESGYRKLLTKSFAACEFYVHNDLTRLPYSLIISKCRGPLKLISLGEDHSCTSA